MENEVSILDELKGLSPFIAGIEKVNVFTVPEGYFDNLSKDILTSIITEETIINLPSSSLSSDDIPNGYFDTLADSILSRIKSQNEESVSDEIRALSPMLYSIQNENVFEVPHQYFGNLTETIVDRVKPKQTKVVAMKRRSNIVIKYAVAAAFTGVMALGVFKFTETKAPIVELPVYVAEGMKVQNVDEELAKISDEEIVKYLEASGSDVKTALVAGSVDENELPSQEDYLMDEKALDKYLNSINVKDLKN